MYTVEAYTQVCMVLPEDYQLQIKQYMYSISLTHLPNKSYILCAILFKRL